MNQFRNNPEQKSTSGLSLLAGEITASEFDTTDYRELLADYSHMRNGDCIASASLEILKLPILSARLRIEIGENPTERSQKARDYLYYTFYNLLYGFDYFKRHLLLALDFGHILFEKVLNRGFLYEGRPTHLISYFAPIHPHTVQKYHYDENMHFSGITHQRFGSDGKTQSVEISADELFVHTHHNEFNDIRGRSVFRPARIYWKEKVNIFMASSRAASRGAGIPKITVNGSLDDPNIRSRAETVGRTIGNTRNAYVLVEKDRTDVEFMPLQNQTDNLKLLQYCDRQIFYNTLTEFMMSGIAENGSRAGTKEHKAPYEQNINAILSELRSALQDLSYEIIDMSFLGKLTENEYPKINFSAINQSDLTTVMDNISQLLRSNAIEKTPEDERFIRELFGLPEIILNTPQA